MSEQEAARLFVQVAAMLFWTKALVGIAIIAILTDIIALAMFVTFRRSANAKLSEQKAILDKVVELLDLVKRHSEAAREQKEAAKQVLCDLKTEAQKTVAAAGVAAEKVIVVAKDTAKQLDEFKSVVIASTPAPAPAPAQQG